ncbi:hypothetical protein MHU86_23981 [Fragilaria crotonensis]|nr:hypothetical protein MHU86_23981 [Fragilaria crotonensis]
MGRNSKRNMNLDMVSKFVEEDLSLGMYMEAGFYQLLSSIRTQTEPLQRNQPKTRVRMGTDPLQISMIQKDNPVQTLLRSMDGIRIIKGETSFRSNIAPVDYRPNSSVPLTQYQNRLLKTTYQTMSLELIGDLSVKNPAFVNILPTHSAGSTAAAAAASSSTSKRSTSSTSSSSDRVWITSFSLTESNGQIQSLDSATGKSRCVGSKTSKSMLWPNESNAVPKMFQEGSTNPKTKYHDALLVSDGFLVPGKNSGGLYVVKNPTNSMHEETVCLTGGSSSKDSWFYHKSVWVDLTGDGRKSILTARAQMNSPFGNKTARTQLVWLEMPKPHAVVTDDSSNNINQYAVEADGSPFDPFHPQHLPWKSHVLDEGPDVMFAVADLDTTDDTIEVISSEFFDRKVSVRSIQKGPSPKVVFRRIIDDQCGAPFSAILADLDTHKRGNTKETDSTNNRPKVVDSGSTVATTKFGDSFSHILVTSQPAKGKHASGEEGGALFAYRVPTTGDWKTEPWKRTTVASGFQVRTNLWNMINPGAPGFVYTFHPRQQQQPQEFPLRQQDQKQRPMIAIAGDCSESAYILQPIEHDGDGSTGSHHDHATATTADGVDPSTRYKLVCEIETGATVGSIGIGYGSFGKSPAGIAKLYLPLFEKNKMLVFALSGAVESRRGP